MNKLFILTLMIFCHIVDDYHLQGILSNMKQKSWWKENAPKDLYKYDYIVALITHSFSWAFMIQLPTLIYKITQPYFIMLIVNMIIHSIVDDLKANKLKINLITDQTIHLIQIVITFVILIK